MILQVSDNHLKVNLYLFIPSLLGLLLMASPKGTAATMQCNIASVPPKGGGGELFCLLSTILHFHLAGLRLTEKFTWKWGKNHYELGQFRIPQMILKINGCPGFIARILFSSNTYWVLILMDYPHYSCPATLLLHFRDKLKPETLPLLSLPVK